MFSFLDKNPKDIVLYYIVELTSSNNKSDSLEVSTKKKNNNYFTSSDPHHDMSGGGCQVGVVRVNWKCYFPNSWQRTMKKPLTLVFWTFACSCCVLPALQYSTWHKCLRKQSTNMSKTKHAKSCQDTTWQTYINKQASNMAVYLLKQSQKLVTATSDAQITNACSAPLEAFYAPNMPNHVRIPPVKQI